MTHVMSIAGAYGLQARGDDSGMGGVTANGIQYATQQIEFYCAQRYSQADLAANEWVKQTAAFLAVMWVCKHRLNGVPKPIADEFKNTIKPQLELIQMGEANIPRIALTRRPIAVDNYHVDQQRFNNQVRVDPTRSTGTTALPRPIDVTAPDQR
jgi:hypothetical protein